MSSAISILSNPPSSNITSTSILVSNHQIQHDLVPVLFSKRSATWRYLQRMHQGGMVLYNTAVLTETDLRRAYPDEKVQKRAIQYFLLGTSIGSVIEIPSVGDCLKALYVVVQEYDDFTAPESKSKMMFLRATGRKPTESEETPEYSLLEVRQLPFNLDYLITFASLCDVIAQVYEKLATEDQTWTLTNMEMFQKIDSRFKKIMTVVSKELESMAREIMLSELNAMDPLGTASHESEWDF
ncbi:hypothetical protein BGZ46_001058 [Entomortierella lignicola]|nr:hypothetical protein BGZ46_001058 [Entomortierella lignicola]